MINKKIEDRTVKEIFEYLLGPENAEKVLKKIQDEFDKGVRGDDLKGIFEHAIKGVPFIKREEKDIFLPIGIAVSFGDLLTIDYGIKNNSSA